MEFNQLVDTAIELNRKGRTKFVDHHKHCSAPQFAADFCTVRIDVGRQSGKTTYILERARPWDAVVLHGHIMVDHYQRAAHTRGLVTGMNVFSAGEFRPMLDIPHRLLGRHWVPRMIYIDEASSIEPLALATIYRAFAAHPDQTFVLLG